MSVLRIGLVGASQHNWNFLAECLKQTDGRVVALADPDATACDRFAAHYRVDALYGEASEMLDEARPDALFIFPGAADILPVALEAIRRGVSVYSDKHIVRTPDDARTLRAALEERPVTLHVSLNKPLAPAYRAALGLLGRDDGIGRPLVYSSDFHAGPYGSLSNFVNNHILFHFDLAYAGIGPFTVQSALVNRTADATVGAIVTVACASGTIGVINASSYSPGETPKERLEIVASHGIVRVENARRIQAHRGVQQSPLFAEGFGLSWEEPGAQLASNTRNGYEEQVIEFAESVAGGGSEWRPTVDRLEHHAARLAETWSLIDAAGILQA